MPLPVVKKVVKKTAADDGRRRRAENDVSVRKEKREEGLLKRRALGAASNESAVTGGAGAGSGAPADSSAASTADGASAFSEVCLEHVEQYVQATNGADVATQLQGVTALRRLLSKESQPPVLPIVGTGVLPRLVSLLASNTHAAGDARLAFEAAWAITNIASTEHTRLVVEAGAVPALVTGMMAADAQLRDQCIWCMGNIVGDSTRYRDALIATPGAMQALMINIQHPETPALLANATWTLSNCCRGKPALTPAIAQPILPALGWLLTQSDAPQVLADTLWGLSYLTDSDESLIQLVVEAGVLPRVVALLGHTEAVVSTPALRVVGNVISGNDAQTQAAVDAGALRGILPLLQAPKRGVRREAAWALSNIAAGTPAQIDALMMAPGLLPSVISVLRADSDWNCRKEAAWVVTNVATSGTVAHVPALASAGAVGALVDALNSSDPRMLCVVLDACDAMLRKQSSGAGGPIADMFEEAGLLPRLEALQDHESEDVYAKCVALIEGFFPNDGEGEGCENGDCAGAPVGGTPAAAPSAFSFGVSAPPSTPAAQPLAPLQLFASPQPAAQGNKPLLCGLAPAPGAGVPPSFNFGSVTFT